MTQSKVEMILFRVPLVENQIGWQKHTIIIYFIALECDLNLCSVFFSLRNNNILHVFQFYTTTFISLFLLLYISIIMVFFGIAYI